MADTLEPVDLAAQRRIINRLRRASGQLNAVIGAVEAGKPCRDVITQLAAVSGALDRAGFAILSNAMQECITAPEEALANEGLTTEEVEKLFLMLA
ncbi:MAG: metal-sensitive transcriptional regulator [Trueperaceae bacterium]